MELPKLNDDNFGLESLDVNKGISISDAGTISKSVKSGSVYKSGIAVMKKVKANTVGERIGLVAGVLALFSVWSWLLGVVILIITTSRRNKRIKNDIKGEENARLKSLEDELRKLNVGLANMRPDSAVGQMAYMQMTQSINTLQTLIKENSSYDFIVGNESLTEDELIDSDDFYA